MATSMTMDEMDEVNKADAKAAAAEPSPEAKEAAEKIQRLDSALRKSEEDRMRLVAREEATRVAPAPAPVVAVPVQEGPKDLTAEELEALVREDPTEALKQAMEQTRRRTTRDLEARLAPLANAGYQSAESQAKVKYADDFALLGPEIDTFIKTMPEAQRLAALGNSEGWDTMLSFIRGKHMDKVITHRIDKQLKERLDSARTDQSSSAPPNISAPTVTSPPVVGNLVFDATTIEIMKTMLGTEDTPAARAEWTKWSNKSSGAI